MIENNQKILDQIRKLQSDFEANKETPEEILEEKLSFLDRINKLIRLILNDPTVSVYDALSPETLESWKKSRKSRLYQIKNFISRNKSKIFYFLLLITITGFLVSEALSFYALDGIISAKTYVKAMLTEVCFIFLNGYRTSSKIELGFVTLLRGSIFSLMMFVITSQVFIQGTTEIGNANSISQQISVVEAQIVEKKEEIDFFKKKNWPRNVARLTIERQELVKKLLKLKEKQAKGSSKEVSKLVRYRMYGRAIFRILLLLISVLVTRRIFKF